MGPMSTSPAAILRLSSAGYVETNSATPARARVSTWKYMGSVFA